MSMQQMIVDASGHNAIIAILKDRVKTASENADLYIKSDTRLFAQKAQKTMRLLPARFGAVPLWITAAFLATTWASEAHGFPDARHAQTHRLANTQRAIAVSNVDFDGTAGDHVFETVQASRFGD